ncbi:hypothetical protein [Sorangium sp. So ce854]|uniref:hypothetical protein n=1 Tax=Sorangium sp. So ce854 TaxID=3133322 RepID=UPI003F646DE9
MKLRVEWPAQGWAAFRRLHWRTASDVGAAIYRFAETGEGELYRYDDDNAVTVRLATDTYHVRLTIDQAEGVLRVWYLYRP